MEKTYLQQVGERLYKCRTLNYYSREELAKRAGVHISSVVKMERGEEAVGIEDALKICNELNYSTEYILTGECGLKEFVGVSQRIFGLPDLQYENLEKVAKAFWSTCPHMTR